MTCITPRARALLLLGAACLAAAPVGAADETGPDTWYAEAMMQNAAGIHVTHHWSKGRKFRAQLVIGGVPLIFLAVGSTYYAIDGVQMTGIAVERGPKAIAEDAKGGRPFLNDGERAIAAGAEKTETERVGGQPVDVYRISDAVGKRTIWVTPDALRLPVKLEQFKRESGQSATTLINWERGMQIPDEFFDPDPRIKLERLSYAEYLERVKKGPVGSIPTFFDDLLHGPRR